MTGLWIFAAAALLGVVMVGAVRTYAARHGVVDRPNRRSSHVAPTPSGGGLGLVLAVLTTALVAGTAGSARLLAAFGAVAVVAAVGWIDDRRSLGVMTRLGAHVVAGSLLLPLVLQPTPAAGWIGLLTAAWWVFWAVSAINVVNFMDGIDGLMGSQMLVFGLHLALLSDPSSGTSVLGLALAGACAGFLVWNWAPARIFMGDVGSGSLGLLAVLGGLLLTREGGGGFVVAFLPLYPVFLDASATIVRRALGGEPIWEAHRRHLYQRLANGGWGHAPVTALYLSAAVLGLMTAQAHGQAVWPWLLGLYVTGVAGTGAALDARAPDPSGSAVA